MTRSAARRSNAQGTLQLGDGANYVGSVTGNILDDGVLDFADPAPQTFSGNISGVGQVVKDGDGTLTLEGTNTFSGAVTANAGTLQPGSPDAFDGQPVLKVNSSGTYNLAGGTGYFSQVIGYGLVTNLMSNSAATLIVEAPSEYPSDTFSGSIQDGVNKNGVPINATVALTVIGVTLELQSPANNTYSGATTLEDHATLQGGGTSLSKNSALTIPTGCELELLGSATIGSLSDGGTAGGTVSSLEAGQTLTVGNDGKDSTFSGSLFGASGLNLKKIGGGTLTLSGTALYLYKGQYLSYAGNTDIDGGVLDFVTNGLPVGQGSSITFGGGTLQWASGNTQDISEQIATIGSGKSAIFDTNGNAVLFNYPLGGDGGLTEDDSTGTGILYLRVANTYKGTTDVKGGTLDLLAANSNKDGPIKVPTIVDGGTLEVNVTDGCAGSTTVDGGTLQLDFANSCVVPITVNGGTLQLVAAQAMGSSAKLVMNGGALDLDGNDLTLISLKRHGGLDRRLVRQTAGHYDAEYDADGEPVDKYYVRGMHPGRRHARLFAFHARIYRTDDSDPIAGQERGRYAHPEWGQHVFWHHDG